jgi:arylsulfatase A-like enzyme
MKNVILLTIDTLRQDVLGCYGNELGLTPFIDSLQNKCIRFANAQSCGPYTQASFPAIMTSSYYHEYPKSKKLSVKRTLVSEPLKEAGIKTAGFHSNAYLSSYFGWNRGWDIFYDSMEAEVTDKVPYIKAGPLNKRVAEWLETRSEKDKSFFLWLHYMDVHEPYVPEKKYIDVVDPSINLRDDETFNLFKEVLLERDVSNQSNVALLKKLYLAHVREIDDATRELFGIMENTDVLEETIVIITSDHGDEFSEHGGLSHDGKMFRELIDVPLMIYDPSMKSGQAVDELVSTIDISPTIVYLFGLPPVEGFKGESLLPVDNLKSRSIFGEAFFKHGTHEPDDLKEVHYYRKENLKIIYNGNDDSWQLYDLSDDPKELKNIIGSHPDAEKLKNKIRPRVHRCSG